MASQEDLRKERQSDTWVIDPFRVSFYVFQGSSCKCGGSYRDNMEDAKENLVVSFSYSKITVFSFFFSL